jgi:tetratricopeptide (TPR) repeat protein
LLVCSRKIELHRTFDDRYAEAVALNNVALIHKRDVTEGEKRFDLARKAFEESLKACEGIYHKKHEALVHNNLGLLYFEMGQHKQAIPQFESSLQLTDLPTQNLDTLI